MSDEQLESENAQLRAELSRTALAAQAVMDENATLRAECERLKSDVAGWKQRHEVEVSHKQNVQEACDGWREECATLRGEVERLREDIRWCLNDAWTVKEINQRLRETLDNQQTKG